MDISNMKAKDFFLTYLKGILLGLISMGIPGLSASTIAIIIGIYYIMIESIANILKDFKHSFPFLITLMLGYATGAVLAAFSVSLLFNNYPLATTLVILGLIFGSIPDMVLDLRGNFTKISGWIVFLIVCAILITYNWLAVEGTEETFPTDLDAWYLIKMGIIGFITASTFVIPGVDFAVVFLSLGLYYPFMNMITDILSFGQENYLTIFIADIKILGVYLIGYLLGCFVFAKLIKFLTKKYSVQMKYASLAFVVAAPILVIKNCVLDNMSFKLSISQTVFGFILATFAFIAIFYVGYKKRQKEKEYFKNLELSILKGESNLNFSLDNTLSNSNEDIELDTIDSNSQIVSDTNYVTTNSIHDKDYLKELVREINDNSNDFNEKEPKK